MIGTAYDTWFCKPKFGLEIRSAYKKHMTEWVNALSGMTQPEILYYYERLRSRQVDCLNSEYMKIGKIQFPVYFQVDAPPPIANPQQRNFHSMLVSTGFPLVPANDYCSIYPFEMVEEPVSLPWLAIPEIKGRKNVSYEMLANSDHYKICGMREKLDGIPFVGVSVHGQSYLVGSFWFPTRIPLAQVEWKVNTMQFSILYPYVPVPIKEGIFELMYHPIKGYNAGEALTFAEGVMLFVEAHGWIEEMRLKRVNTVEVEIVDGKLNGSEQHFMVEDGIWECSYENGVFFPLKCRPSKVPTLKLTEKLLALPTISALPTCAHPPTKVIYRSNFLYNVKEGKSSQIYPLEGLHLPESGSRYEWGYYGNWEFKQGEVKDRRFYFKREFIDPKSVNQKTFCFWNSPIFYSTSANWGLVQGGVLCSSMPKQDTGPGVALLSILGTTVGVVAESGKLYTLPGGKLESREAAWDGLNREMNEELPPGWGFIDAVGPFVSERCTYFVSLKAIPGVLYRSPTFPDMHPCIKRIYSHFMENQKNLSTPVTVRFVETSVEKSNIYIGDFLNKPRTLQEMTLQFGTNWGHQVGKEGLKVFVLGRQVWKEESLKKHVDIENSTIGEYAPIVKKLMDLLPMRFDDLCQVLKFSSYELSHILDFLPTVEKENGVIDWDYTP